MGIKRYIADKDATITNAFKENGITRATKANMGGSDILEVFSIYGQTETSSSEVSRILVQFPTTTIAADRAANVIAASGSCEFILNLSNAPHSFSTPENLSISVSPVSSSWIEGVGLDMETFKDLGAVNWLSSSLNTLWATEGADFLSSSLQTTIVESTDDLKLDITSFVEDWLSGAVVNNGLIIKLSSSLESAAESYYTKKFFARKSQFFFKRPFIEARSNDSVKDGRLNFFASSPLLPQADNLHTLFLRNSISGRLRDIPSVGTGSLLVSLYSGTLATGPTGARLAIMNNDVLEVTGGYVSTGVYTASLGLSGTLSYVFDVWKDLSGVQLHTGSAIEVMQHSASESETVPEFTLSAPDLKNSYRIIENARIRVQPKNKIWYPNLYTIASFEQDLDIIEDLYYRVIRVVDDYEVIPFGTGSIQHTLTSYDKDGNYFNLDMATFEPGFSYKVGFAQKFNDEYYILNDTFKFRVEK